MTRRLRLAAPCLIVATLAVPAGARPCSGEDLELIEALLGELDDRAPGGAGAPALDEALLVAVALEAGCEWPAPVGGAAEALERLRWREGPADGPSSADVEPVVWWRVLLPRLELRWFGSREVPAAVAAWDVGFEVWLLWSLVPPP